MPKGKKLIDAYKYFLYIITHTLSSTEAQKYSFAMNFTLWAILKDEMFNLIPI